eukprot:Opistho-1_new@24981
MGDARFGAGDNAEGRYVWAGGVFGRGRARVSGLCVEGWHARRLVTVGDRCAVRAAHRCARFPRCFRRQGAAQCARPQRGDRAAPRAEAGLPQGGDSPPPRSWGGPGRGGRAVAERLPQGRAVRTRGRARRALGRWRRHEVPCPGSRGRVWGDAVAHCCSPRSRSRCRSITRVRRSSGGARQRGRFRSPRGGCWRTVGHCGGRRAQNGRPEPDESHAHDTPPSRGRPRDVGGRALPRARRKQRGHRRGGARARAAVLLVACSVRECGPGIAQARLHRSACEGKSDAVGEHAFKHGGLPSLGGLRAAACDGDGSGRGDGAFARAVCGGLADHGRSCAYGCNLRGRTRKPLGRRFEQAIVSQRQGR